MLARKRYQLSISVIILGVLLTAVSAYMSHSLVSKNQHRVNQLRSDANRIERQITERWQNVLSLEQKQDLLVLLLAQQSTSTALIKQVAKRFYERLDTPLPIEKKLNYQDLDAAMHTHRETELESINALYLEKLTFDRETKRIEQENSFYSAIALFLQLLGMILVLSKHLFD